MASKSLGTLTLDLVAKTGGFTQGMTKAERSSEKWRKQVEQDAKKAGIAIAATATAVTTAAFAIGVAMTKSGLDSVDAQAKLARSLDTTYDSITALKLAAAEGGLGDLEGSLTRLNRRLGAAETGGGAAAKTVAALNLDLRDLSASSADERVAKIADAIKLSGASAQQAARYLQDLGFQQREAADFFSQGGDSIRAYTERVKLLGLSLSDFDAAKVEEANDAIAILGDLSAGAGQQLAVHFAPILTAVGTKFEEMAIEAGGVGPVVERMVDKTVTVIAYIADAIDDVSRSFESDALAWDRAGLMIRFMLHDLANDVISGPVAAIVQMTDLLNKIPGVSIDTSSMTVFVSELQDDLEDLRSAVGDKTQEIADLWNKPKYGKRLLQFYQDAKDESNSAASAAAGLGKALNGQSGMVDKAEKAKKSLTDTIGKEISALERAARTWGMTTDELKIHDLTTQGATTTQLKYAKGLLETVAGLEKAKQEQEAYNEIAKGLRTDEEKLTDEFRERIAVLDAMAGSYRISSDEYAKMVERASDAAFSDAPEFGGLAPEIGGPAGELNKIDEAEEKLQEWYDKQIEMLEEFRSERADLTEQWDEQEADLHQQHQDKLADIEHARRVVQVAAGEEFFGTMSGAAKAFFGENSKLYKAAFALEKSYAIGKALMNIPKSYSDAYASVVGIPYVGPVLAPIAGVAAAAAQVAQASAIGNISMTGMAHDGLDSVPKTGTWLLEKGERVTTAETSAKLDKALDGAMKSSNDVNVSVYEDASKAGKVERDESGNVSVYVSNIMQEGELYDAIGSKFGLRGVGS